MGNESQGETGKNRGYNLKKMPSIVFRLKIFKGVFDITAQNSIRRRNCNYIHCLQLNSSVLSVR